MRRTVALALVTMGVATTAVSPQRPDTVGAANEFLASLDRTQHRAAVKQVGDAYRTKWKYTPVQREGVSWKTMTDEQEKFGLSLLKSVLSDVGMKKAGRVRELEQHLAELSGNTTFRDHEAYYFTFFGTPSRTEEWAWRYEGHHVSLSFSYQGSKLVSSTPQFFGSNPAEVKTGAKKGLRMLSKEQDAAFEFLASLSDEQRAKAIVSNSAPRDIFTGESETAKRQKLEGVRYSELKGKQQFALLALIQIHSEAQHGLEAARRLGQLAAVGHAGIRFVWMGSTKPGNGHYYRIQGPTFLIEYDNIQNNANHIHAAWRDFDGDFGRDALGEHYRSSEHHSSD